MPQEFDAVTGNFITQEDGRADPLPPVLHRGAVAAADGAAKPATNSAAWLVNPGNRVRARVYVSTTGSPTTATVRPYLRSGGAGGQAGTGPLQTVAGSPNYDACFDVQTDGDDLLCQIETLSGGTAPAVSISVSWR